MTTKTENKSKTLDFLPRGSVQVIFSELGGKITLRTIQRILKANKLGDPHGVMDIALRIATEHQKKVEKQLRQQAALKLNRSTTKTK